MEGTGKTIPSMTDLLRLLMLLCIMGALLYPIPVRADFQAFPIDSVTSGPKDVVPVDLDGDLDMDLVVAFYFENQVCWFENDGYGWFDKHVVGTVTTPSAVAVADFNGDETMDIAVSSFESGLEGWNIAWYENDGSENFTLNVVDTLLVGAEDLVAVTLDDGTAVDLAAVGYETDQLVWYENSGSGAFTRHVINSDLIHGESIIAADIDGDNNTDLLTTSFHNNDIAWWANGGGSGGAVAFTKHLLPSLGVSGPKDARVVNLDGDKDMDVVAVGWFSGNVVWFENDGSESFTRHTIDTGLDELISVDAGDFDGDGDLDVAAAEFSGDRLLWYENDGLMNFTRLPVDDFLIGAEGVVATDMNSDTADEILAVGVYGDQLNMYQFVHIVLSDYQLSEYDGNGNGNGIPDSGETWTLELELTNDGDQTLTGVSAQVFSDQPGYVYFAHDTATYSDIVPDASQWSQDPHIRFTLDSVTPCGQSIRLTVNLQSDQNVRSYNILLTAGGYVDDMESGEGDWIHYADQGTDDWAIQSFNYAHSPPNVWHGSDSPIVTDKSLEIGGMEIGDDTVFSFWHTYEFETNYDGGVIELSTNGGVDWTDLGIYITSWNGYNGLLSNTTGNPIGDRMAWTSGTVNGMEKVEVDLSAFSGSTAAIRFRIGCDSSVADPGWFIDDVTVYGECVLYYGQTLGCSYTCIPASGTVPFTTAMTVTLDNLYMGQTRRMAARIDAVIANGNSFSNWKSGFTNIAAGDSYQAGWNQTIPALGSLVGINVFSLDAVDVTPSPYNQPPRPPSGDTAGDACTVTANAP